jgi:hypothetical protein
MRRAILLALAIFCGTCAVAEARHGLFRRLFTPRIVCEPLPPACLPVAPPAFPTPAPIAPEQDRLEGKVTWVGELPKQAKEKSFRDESWIIDNETRAVANVVVYIMRPADKILPIREEDKLRKQTIVMDTLHSAFRPHMVSLYSEWFDGKNKGSTGQKFLFKNNYQGVYNAKFIGAPTTNPGLNLLFNEGDSKEMTFKQQRLPITVNSDLIPWARAYIWTFDHPYYAITKADGTFVIPHVPTGMELRVQAWHEHQGWQFTKDGKSMTFANGRNTLNFEMSASKPSRAKIPGVRSTSPQAAGPVVGSHFADNSCRKSVGTVAECYNR